ncbi:hypothetical protein L484_002131 [Morus notabilis]|uniref:Uncharacterized protein n=1 Tax=Morus notabilis TaxID=981085 RepID=W9S9T3_9ROSA|nr:hypothetical protein L484_002131 [Morus notabilis]
MVGNRDTRSPSKRLDGENIGHPIPSTRLHELEAKDRPRDWKSCLDLFADMLVHNSRAKEMAPKLREALGALEDTKSEQSVALLQSTSTKWESKYKSLLASSESDKETLDKTKSALEHHQKAFNEPHVPLEQMKKELELAKIQSTADQVKIAERYKEIDDEYWKGFYEAKDAIVDYNPRVKLKLVI